MLAQKRTLKILVIFSLSILIWLTFMKKGSPEPSAIEPIEPIATQKPQRPKKDTENVPVWQNTPRVTLMCRLYAGSALEYFNTFYLGYLLFWPARDWLNSDLVLIFDDESEADHRMGKKASKNRYFFKFKKKIKI